MEKHIKNELDQFFESRINKTMMLPIDKAEPIRHNGILSI